MPTLTLEKVAFVLCVVSVVVGILIALRGGRLLALADRATLLSWGADLGVSAAGVLGGLAFFLAGRKPLVSIAVAICAYLLWTYRLPYRVAKLPWPASARRQLMIGYALPVTACLLYLVLIAVQHI